MPVYLKDDFLVYKKPGTMVLPATVVKGLGFWVRLDGPNDVNGWYTPCGIRACNEVVSQGVRRPFRTMFLVAAVAAKLDWQRRRRRKPNLTEELPRP